MVLTSRYKYSAPKRLSMIHALIFFVCDALLRHVHVTEGRVERSNAKEKSDNHVVKEYGIFNDYHDMEAEVIVFSYCHHLNSVLDIFNTYGVFKDIRLVKYTRRNTEKIADKVNITFVDSIYGPQDLMNCDDTSAYRSVSCEAFGNCKPVVTIQNEAGKLLPVVELKQASGMSSRVIASLQGVPLDQAVGKYICTATAGNQTIKKTIEVKKVIRPETLMAEVVVNNTEEIIAVCIARGQPAPEISFSVNSAKDDKIEKRPLLETESTVKSYHVSKYQRKGGLSADRWFESNSERCPKPEYYTETKVTDDPDVAQKMIAIKPLPYLSRQRVNVLFCRADGYDDVYVTKEVTAKISRMLHLFMTHANNLAFTKVFG